MKKVQVFGLQRSGTNYLHWVIARNLPVKATKSGGWKHGFPWERRIGLHGAKRLPTTISRTLRQNDIQPVIVGKDLDHWLMSLSRDPKDYDRGAGAVEADTRVAWVRFYDEWSEHGPVVRYEDFIARFKPSLSRLAELLGVEPHSFEEPDKVPNSPDWTPEDRARYL